MEQPIIVIFKGQSQYDVMRYFADYIAAAFEQYGYPVKIIDFLENDAVNHLNATIQKQEIFFSSLLTALALISQCKENHYMISFKCLL